MERTCFASSDNTDVRSGSIPIAVLSLSAQKKPPESGAYSSTGHRGVSSVDADTNFKIKSSACRDRSAENFHFVSSHPWNAASWNVDHAATLLSVAVKATTVCAG